MQSDQCLLELTKPVSWLERGTFSDFSASILFCTDKSHRWLPREAGCAAEDEAILKC